MEEDKEDKFQKVRMPVDYHKRLDRAMKILIEDAPNLLETFKQSTNILDASICTKTRSGVITNRAFTSIAKTIGLKSKDVWDELYTKGYLDSEGNITSKFNPKSKNTSLSLDEKFNTIEKDILKTLLKAYKQGKTNKSYNYLILPRHQNFYYVPLPTDGKINEKMRTIQKEIDNFDEFVADIDKLKYLSNYIIENLYLLAYAYANTRFKHYVPSYKTSGKSKKESNIYSEILKDKFKKQMWLTSRISAPEEKIPEQKQLKPDFLKNKGKKKKDNN